MRTRRLRWTRWSNMMVSFCTELWDYVNQPYDMSRSHYTCFEAWRMSAQTVFGGMPRYGPCNKLSGLLGNAQNWQQVKSCPDNTKESQSWLSFIWIQQQVGSVLERRNHASQAGGLGRGFLQCCGFCDAAVNPHNPRILAGFWAPGEDQVGPLPPISLTSFLIPSMHLTENFLSGKLILKYIYIYISFKDGLHCLQCNPSKTCYLLIPWLGIGLTGSTPDLLHIWGYSPLCCGTIWFCNSTWLAPHSCPWALCLAFASWWSQHGGHHF